jgi:dihydrolipoamide dehydrogenase
VGLTEAKARQRGHDVKVGRFPVPVIGKAQILGATEGMVKIVSDARYDEMLGAHIIGPHATELIAEACIGLQLETTVEEVIRTMHAHPTVSETFREAAEDVHGIAIDM